METFKRLRAFEIISLNKDEEIDTIAEPPKRNMI
jgi:hypothetical protein